MTIETKFEEGCEVFYISRQSLSVKKAKIISFWGLSLERQVTWKLDAEEFDFPGTKSNVCREEKYLFSTKEELLKSL